MGISLKRGRDFDEHDTASAAPVIIVNDVLASRYFRDEDPVGHRIRFGGSMWRTITGVAGSVKHQRPTREPVPMIYLPYAQAPSRNMWIAVRTSGDPARLTGVLRATVHAMDSDVLLEEMRTMQQVIEDSLVERKMMAALVAGFAWFALVLATIGIYGVIAYSVSQRTHEIGVRVALGATAQGVVALVLKRGAGLAALGIAIGVPAAWALSRFLASLLYGISPRDVTVFAGVPLLHLAVALAASYIPARRAAKVDPVIALRIE
jgi:putative ABC transport system permease protein